METLAKYRTAIACGQKRIMNEEIMNALTPMKAFVAYSSIVVKSRKSFFMRSKDSKLKGIRQVFIKRSTKSLKGKRRNNLI